MSSIPLPGARFRPGHRRPRAAATRLPAIAEFQESLQRQARQVQHATLATAAGLLAGWILAWVAWGWLPAVAREFATQTDGHWSVAVLVPLALIVLATCGVGVWTTDRLVQCDPNLHCPGCHGPLDALGPLVVATRSCPHCGTQVLAD